jgi:hypothetical protein
MQAEAGARPEADERQVELRLQQILARYPGRYSEEQVAMIRERIGATVDTARTLRAVPLANGDSPWGDEADGGR